MCGGTEMGQGPRSFFRMKENRGQNLSPVVKEKKEKEKRTKSTASDKLGVPWQSLAQWKQAS